MPRHVGGPVVARAGADDQVLRSGGSFDGGSFGAFLDRRIKEVDKPLQVFDYFLTRQKTLWDVRNPCDSLF